MAGSYCRFCGHRCFVWRLVPDGPSKGWGGHMATCAGGMAHDLEVLGYTHETAVNPLTDHERAAAIAAEVREEESRIPDADQPDPVIAQARKRAAELSEMADDPNWLGI